MKTTLKIIGLGLLGMGWMFAAIFSPVTFLMMPGPGDSDDESDE